MNNYLVTTRLVLNNWHYISEKLLSFHDSINFFTGHSGSGKSTVIDALQVLLYADTDGRGFFNKAAKDDSNRTLMEYLRGMNNVKENGEATYLRNKNFSSTIALELMNAQTKEYQTIGVSFDVEVGTNDIDRMFFWHKGQLLTNQYRYEKKTMTCNQVKEYLSRSLAKEDWWFSRTNDKFRSKLYETYLGGLDERKFPMLFKKAISFRMDTKLEDFVKEFICVEKDIHIEDMQESVVQYVRLKRKLEDTKQEIEILRTIHEQYERYDHAVKNIEQLSYNEKQLQLDVLQQQLKVNQTKQREYEKDSQQLEQLVMEKETVCHTFQAQLIEIKTAINNSGYEHYVQEKESQTELVRRCLKSKERYDKIASDLALWRELEKTNEVAHQYLEHFATYAITEEEIQLLHKELQKVREEFSSSKEELQDQSNQLRSKIQEAKKEIKQLQSGTKAYPTYLIEARESLEARLSEEYGQMIPVHILADLIDIKDETWQNAVEGFMSNQKLSLIVAPEYVTRAMELYEAMDAKKYYKVALIDTEKVIGYEKAPLANALSQEIDTELPYVQSYINFLMGHVVKCESLDELRQQRSGITKECILYHGYKIQHIDPKHYKNYAYIGQSAIERRLHILEVEVEMMEKMKLPLDEQIKKLNTVLSYEALEQPATDYLDMITDIKRIHTLNETICALNNKIEELKSNNLAKWKEEEKRLTECVEQANRTLTDMKTNYNTKQQDIARLQEEFLQKNEEWASVSATFQYEEVRNEAYQAFLQERASFSNERLRSTIYGMLKNSNQQAELEYEALTKVRETYRSSYSFRGFSVVAKENASYDTLLEKLESDKLVEFTEKANEQAKKAIYHFKTDFIYKIRDAIKEAVQQKEDLNRILKKTDFGKEKYRFVIEKNKGEDGKFYSMFMDEDLEINPNRLSNHMDNQMDLFSSHHEDQYSDLINELIDIFMPPENCDPKELEEARRNIEKYADYRTYLSFDMEQIIDGMAPMRLSKMLTKNSGGEGQNPLYVALLASFAQVYRLTLRQNIRRRPTPRLVILDEAFSKMDGEKVASCVELIRKLGFQAIISATNDKIQNYVESVDKTFVFANPNKSYISIQAFEKREFHELLELEGVSGEES